MVVVACSPGRRLTRKELCSCLHCSSEFRRQLSGALVRAQRKRSADAQPQARELHRQPLRLQAKLQPPAHPAYT